MDYEKKYKEALERAKKLKENPKAIFFEEKNIHVCDYLFPELRESEDERIRKELIEYFNAYSKDYFGELKKSHILAWLEKQGNEPKFKPVWSKDDERICSNIVNDIANDKSMCKFEISKGICDEQINWLKSLKDCITWKPSDEQMKALHDLNLNISYAGQRQVLIELYNDLKKLKGE